MWIVDHVAPNMVYGRVPRKVCIVLGRALLWKVWEVGNATFGRSVPSSITAWVMAVKPDRRASLDVTGIDAELHMFGILGNHGKGSRARHDQRQLG